MSILSILLLILAICLAVKVGSKLIKWGAILYIIYFVLTTIVPRLGILLG